ncbi:o-succinylbenzoate synthase [Mycolicibacterium sp.]|uniref:o-succinylbenzoate synthase n=1 Tax=Mycolicibacterium sp. TaxID=2320850 RepID=UPI0028AA5A07|nr:o-succinylbenzoate synthase [Mycolicibacterium sp.]
MKTWIDFDAAPVFAIALTDPIGGVTVCEGMVIEGPQGWGEFSPPPSSDGRQDGRWLTAAIEVGTVGWPDPVRGRVPVAVTVPSVDPGRARQIVANSGCATAAVRVGDSTGSLEIDIARVEAVRDALGPSAVIRCDANGNWDVETAVAAITALDRAAGGMEFVEQPCRSLDDVAAVRRRVSVPVAVDQSMRDGVRDGDRQRLHDAADIAVLTVGPLGGVRRALRVAETCGLPCTVAAEPETSVGLAGGLALAGVLPDSGYASALAGALLLSGDVVTPGRRLVPVDGHLPVAPMPPGPDRARLVDLVPADPPTVARWRQRLAAAQVYL